MRRGAVMIVVAALAVFATAAQALAPQIALRPGRGRPRTHFTVSFVAPASAGAGTSTEITYTVFAQGPVRQGCESSAGAQITSAVAGARAEVTLRPAPKRWCRGVFNGTINEMIRPRCGGPVSQIACPLSADFIALSHLGTFRFRVR
jgi:hypothetical protein